MDWPHINKEIRRQNWIILVVMGTISSLFTSPPFTLGIIVGGILITANFHALQHTICRSFSHEGIMENNKVAIIAKYYFRLAIMGIIIYILIIGKWVEPVGLVIGLSTVLISILGLGMRAVLKILP